MKKFSMRFGTLIASMALLVSVAASNQTCILIIGQPELPDSVKSLRKF